MSLPQNAARGLVWSEIHKTAAERKRKILWGSYTAEVEQLSKYCIPSSCPHFQNRFFKPVKRFPIKLHLKTAFKSLERKVILQRQETDQLGGGKISSTQLLFFGQRWHNKKQQQEVMPDKFKLSLNTESN